MYFELSKQEFELSTDPARLDLETIHKFLSGCYWAKHRPRTVLEKAIRNSLCFGVYCGRRQVGFARVVSDYATFGYLTDVYVAEEFRGRGLARWLVSSILSHPELQGLRRWLLTTRDTQRLYRQLGFSGLLEPENHMQLMQSYPGEKSRFRRGLESLRLSRRGPGKDVSDTLA